MGAIAQEKPFTLLEGKSIKFTLERATLHMYIAASSKINLLYIAITEKSQ